MEFKVPFGRDKESGTLAVPGFADAALHYVCPRCDIALVLRNGPVKSKHFAHKGLGCNYDLIMHTLAQEIILNNDAILVEDTIVRYTNPRKEIKISNSRADAIIDTTKYPMLLIEITVTNTLTEAKLKDYAKYNFLEIDLRGSNGIADIDVFKNYVLSNPYNRTFSASECEHSNYGSNENDSFWPFVIGGLAIILAAFYNLFRPRIKKRY